MNLHRGCGLMNIAELAFIRPEVFANAFWTKELNRKLGAFLGLFQGRVRAITQISISYPLRLSLASIALAFASPLIV